MKYLLILASLITVLSACSSSTTSLPPQADPKLDELALYISRSSLNATEFEQYKLIPGQLFCECGTIARGRFMPSQQELVDLSSEAETKLALLSDDLLKFLQRSRQQFDDAGTNSGFADPGQFSLDIQSAGDRFKLKTSLDSVVNAERIGERKARKLSEALRAAAPEKFCGNTTFYGLGRRNY